MHLQVDEDLKEAQRNFRSVRSDVWDKVITPIVEKNYPMADMKILQKYSISNRYSSFTDTDRGRQFFKPAHTDLSETQFKWTMGRDEFNALYHYELQSRGHQATIRVEYEQTQRQKKTRTITSQLMRCKKTTGILLNQMALMKILPCITGHLIIDRT